MPVAMLLAVLIPASLSPCVHDDSKCSSSGGILLSNECWANPDNDWAQTCSDDYTASPHPDDPRSEFRYTCYPPHCRCDASKCSSVDDDDCWADPSYEEQTCRDGYLPIAFSDDGYTCCFDFDQPPSLPPLPPFPPGKAPAPPPSPKTCGEGFVGVDGVADSSTCPAGFTNRDPDPDPNEGDGHRGLNMDFRECCVAQCSDKFSDCDAVDATMELRSDDRIYPENPAGDADQTQCCWHSDCTIWAMDGGTCPEGGVLRDPRDRHGCRHGVDGSDDADCSADCCREIQKTCGEGFVGVDGVADSSTCPAGFTSRDAGHPGLGVNMDFRDCCIAECEEKFSDCDAVDATMELWPDEWIYPENSAGDADQTECCWRSDCTIWMMGGGTCPEGKVLRHPRDRSDSGGADECCQDPRSCDDDSDWDYEFNPIPTNWMCMCGDDDDDEEEDSDDSDEQMTPCGAGKYCLSGECLSDPPPECWGAECQKCDDAERIVEIGTEGFTFGKEIPRMALRTGL